MFRRKRRVKSTPTLTNSPKTGKQSQSKSKSKSKKTKKLKIFKKKSKKDKVITIKIHSKSNANANANANANTNPSIQSYTKLKSPSTSNTLNNNCNPFLNSNLNANLNGNSNDDYIITAYLSNGILTITVYHGIKALKWRQQFTQNSFKNISIHKISKILIRSIQETANKTNEKRLNYKYKKNQTKEIKIFEYNSLCYVTLIDSNLPSFALRPVYETTQIYGHPPSTRKYQRYSTPNICHSNVNKKHKLYTNRHNVLENEYIEYVNYYNGNNRNHIQKWNNNANFNKISVNNTNFNRISINNRNDTFGSPFGSNNTLLSHTPISSGILSNSNYVFSDDTNTTITMDEIDKGPGFNHNNNNNSEYKYKINTKDNVKYGFV